MPSPAGSHRAGAVGGLPPRGRLDRMGPPDFTSGRAQTGGRRRAGSRPISRGTVVILIAGLAAATGAGAAMAGPGGQTADPSGVEVVLPEVVVTAPRPSPSCVRPGAGGDEAIDYGCLNKALALRAAPAPGIAAVIGGVAAQAHVPSRIGTFSYSATAQRMGSAFGRSATPYRPPPTAFSRPITGARP